MSLPKPYYQDDQATIYCADARDALHYLGLFDFLFTDPPYGLGMAAHLTNSQRKNGMKTKDWDGETSTDALNLARSVSVEQIIWGGNYYGLPPTRCVLSWFKPDAPPSMGNVEYAWTNLDCNSRMLSHSISATNAERIGHPTQKPLRVTAWAMDHFICKSGYLVDPFMGSGTTLVAAKLRGIKAVGIEIEEKYCAMAVERLRQGVLITA